MIKKINKNIKISWPEFQYACILLSKMVKKESMNDAVMLAIANGGLFVAGMLGRIFNHDNIAVIGTKRKKMENGEYTINQTSAPFLCCKSNILKFSTKILLVDDIFDSGSTLEFLHNSFRIFSKRHRVMYATAYYKAPKLVKSCNDVSEYLISPFQVDPAYWMEYPWEDKVEQNQEII